MNEKRQRIAWQYWTEKNGPIVRTAWGRIEKRTPQSLALAFAWYVSARWMGGNEGFWKRLAGRIVFYSLRIIAAVMK